MSLSLQPLTSKEQLNRFLEEPERRPYATFFQTWEWGEFQRSRGHPIERLGVFDGSTLLATALTVEETDRFGPFLYSPRGPVVDYQDSSLTAKVLDLLRRELGRHASNPVCLRLDPALGKDSMATKPFRRLGFRDAGRFTQVERSWISELQPGWEEQIEWQRAHGMRSNLPRYLRRAEREGVVVRPGSNADDLETFLDMLHHLDNRKHGIGLQSREYYRLQFAAMAPSGYERVFIAEHEGRPLASALIAIYGNEASYLWGASYDRERELRAPHYMHFRIMRYAYEHGCRRYNFWGVVKPRNHHPGYRGYGYSEFKRSFGGNEELYQRSQDYVYRPLRYVLTYFNDVRRLRTAQLD